MGSAPITWGSKGEAQLYHQSGRLRPSFRSSVRLRMMCNCARDIRRQRQTKLIPHSRAIKGSALSTFCTSIFNGFFNESSFHRFLGRQTLVIFNLRHGSSKLKDRYNLFTNGDRSETTFLVWLTPARLLADRYTMLPGNDGDRHSRFRTLLNNRVFFLLGTPPTLLWS